MSVSLSGNRDVDVLDTLEVFDGWVCLEESVPTALMVVTVIVVGLGVMGPRTCSSGLPVDSRRSGCSQEKHEV